MYLVVLAVTSLGFSYARYYLRPSLPLAVTGALADIAIAVTMIWLAGNNQILNPAFAAAAGWSPGATDWLNAGLILLSAITLLQAVGTAVGRARQC